MRDDLRRDCSEIWVIDCSPEGHQPDVPTRIFEAMQQEFASSSLRVLRIRIETYQLGSDTQRYQKANARRSLRLSLRFR